MLKIMNYSCLTNYKQIHLETFLNCPPRARVSKREGTLAAGRVGKSAKTEKRGASTCSGTARDGQWPCASEGCLAPSSGEDERAARAHGMIPPDPANHMLQISENIVAVHPDKKALTTNKIDVQINMIKRRFFPPSIRQSRTVVAYGTI